MAWMKTGKVYLVGAGPGDLKLITVKGQEALTKADVLLYDRLVNPKLLDFAPGHCEFIYCGKLPDRHILRQEQINELLVEKALEGKTVVRLKGGDPGVFGRVGEEAAALAHHNITFEMVPGITSGIAAPLYAGIPVTHREYGESFAIVTAHDKSNQGQPNLNWAGLAKGIDTIAFYMGIGNLPAICENLQKYGRRQDTPVILIQWGTFGRQRCVEGTLANIVQRAEEEKLTNPAITLVGDIISLREKLQWFEKKPLFGRQILLVRTGTRSSDLAGKISEQGADVIEFPKWKKERTEINAALLNQIHHYHSILFTSPESVDDFFSDLFRVGKDIREITATLYGASVKSKRALNARGLKAELVSKLDSSPNLLVVGEEHLLHLEKAKEYEEADYYLTSHLKFDDNHATIFHHMMSEANLDTVVFPSNKSVTCLIEGLMKSGLNVETFFAGKRVICMGEKTKNGAEEHGIYVDQISEKATIPSLLETLIKDK